MNIEISREDVLRLVCLIESRIEQGDIKWDAIEELLAIRFELKQALEEQEA